MQSQVRFNRGLEKVVREALQSQVGFNRVLGKVPGGFGAEPG